MLQIKSLGHACFQITSGDNLTVVTDPFDEKIGSLPTDLQADIVTTSHDHFDHAATERVAGEPRVFDWPGEYEVGGVQIRGYASWHDDKKGSERGENVIFVFRFPEATVAHLGDLGHELDAETIEKIGQIDILLIPVGGTYTLDAKGAKKMVDAIEPRMVIPMHFADPAIKVEGIAEISEFLKLTGKADLQPEKLLKVKSSALPVEGMEVRWLQR